MEEAEEGAVVVRSTTPRSSSPVEAAKEGANVVGSAFPRSRGLVEELASSPTTKMKPK